MTGLLDYAPITATCCAVPQFLPQIHKLATTGDTAGVSWSWAALTGVNNAAWITYFTLLPSAQPTRSRGASASTWPPSPAGCSRSGRATWPPASTTPSSAPAAPPASNPNSANRPPATPSGAT